MQRFSQIVLVFLLAAGGVARADMGSLLLATSSYAEAGAITVNDCLSPMVAHEAYKEAESNIESFDADIEDKLSGTVATTPDQKKFRRKLLKTIASKYLYKVDGFSTGSVNANTGHVSCSANIGVNYQTREYGNIIVMTPVVFDVWLDGGRHFVSLNASFASDFASNFTAALQN